MAIMVRMGPGGAHHPRVAQTIEASSAVRRAQATQNIPSMKFRFDQSAKLMTV